MGRPPIGKVAMTGAERLRRYHLKRAQAVTARIRALQAEVARLKAEKPQARSATDAEPLKARIAELAAELARERRQRPAEPAHEHTTSRAAPHHTPRKIDPKDESKLMKRIRRLDSPDSEVVAAVRALANELKARGRGFQELGDLTAVWDAEDAAQQPKKPKSVDWDAVKSAIDQYVDGKTRVTINLVIRAVDAKVPTYKQQSSELRYQSHGFIIRHLRSLGFTISASNSSAERKKS
jgi:hypothetical protein